MSVETLKARLDLITNQFSSLEALPDSPGKDHELDHLLVEQDKYIRALCDTYNAENPGANWRPVTGMTILNGAPVFNLARTIATSDEMYQALTRMHQGGKPE